MEEKLREFLLSREVSVECVTRMEAEKIDIEAIMGMSSHELKQYIPRCGDRISVINFCRRQSTSSKCASRTISLLEKLKRGQKLTEEETQTHSKKLKESDDTKRPRVGRKPQATRKIQLGWILNNTPVRQSKGGGTRDVTVNKSCKKVDLIRIAKELFLPNKKSDDKCECDLLDYQRTSMQEHLTVGEIYDITKMNVLRFYLSTSTTEKKKITRRNRSIKYTLDSEDDLEDTSEFLSINKGNNSNLVELKRSDDLLGFSLNNIDEHEQQKTLDDVSSFATIFNVDTLSSDGQFIDFDFENPPLNVAISNDTINTNLELTIPVDSPPFSDLNIIRTDNHEDNKDVTLLRIHRGKIFEELLTAFQEEYTMDNIRIVMILPNGDCEKADDQGGVFRDTLSEFWNTFYDKCTVGTTMKVPYLRHDFGEKHWKAVAKILLKGYSEEKYFPIKLAPAFMKNCFEQTSIDDNVLIDNFKKFVSESESDVINEALNNFSKSNEDIIDFFETYESKWAPTVDNVYTLIRDIAHKEIIQKPAFVARCFGEEFKKQNNTLDVLQIEALYEKLKPSAKNCLAQVTLEDDEDLNSMKKEHFAFLKKFIKEGDDRLRSLFLRFCTGSDLPLVPIKVSFDGASTSEFKRCPVAHTCSGVLILPLSYESYVDFRNEFNNLLTAKIWIMDII